MNKKDIISKIHLIISVLVVIPAATVYGFCPNLILDISPETIDENSFLKAVMGIYMGFALLWLFGLFKKTYLKTALISNLVFMLGLGFGRLLSLFLDGQPTTFYHFGTFGELFLGFYGLWVLNNEYGKKL